MERGKKKAAVAKRLDPLKRAIRKKSIGELAHRVAQGNGGKKVVCALVAGERVTAGNKWPWVREVIVWGGCTLEAVANFL